MAKHIEHWLLSRLKPNKRNPRLHSDAQIAAIAGSILAFGFNAPILVDSSGGILAGPGRYLACLKLGIDTVPVIVLDHLSETEKRAYLLADNKLAELSSFDDDLLREELAELRDTEIDLGTLGFSDDELAVLLADASDGSEAGDAEEEIPEAPAEPVTRADDIWTISGHKIICGDARDRDVVNRLFDGARADLCITSPPYSDQREYTGEMRGVLWLDLMRGAFAALPANDETQVFVNLGLVHRSNEWIPYWEPWIEYMRSIGWRRFGWYVWDQGPGLPGDWNGRLAPAFEFIFHFNRKSIHPNKTKDCIHAGDSHGPSGLRGTDGQVGGWCHQDRSIQDTKIPDSVIRVMRHKGAIAGGQHPAVLAVGIVEELILAYTKPNALIFDPFLGSASVTIAALKTGRRAYGTEISPAYCDVGLRRMMAISNETPVLQETGQTFAEVAQARGVPIDQAINPKQQDARRHNGPAPFYGSKRRAS